MAFALKPSPALPGSKEGRLLRLPPQETPTFAEEASHNLFAGVGCRNDLMSRVRCLKVLDASHDSDRTSHLFGLQAVSSPSDCREAFETRPDEPAHYLDPPMALFSTCAAQEVQPESSNPRVRQQGRDDVL